MKILNVAKSVFRTCLEFLGRQIFPLQSRKEMFVCCWFGTSGPHFEYQLETSSAKVSKTIVHKRSKSIAFNDSIWISRENIQVEGFGVFDQRLFTSGSNREPTFSQRIVDFLFLGTPPLQTPTTRQAESLRNSAGFRTGSSIRAKTRRYARTSTMQILFVRLKPIHLFYFCLFTSSRCDFACQKCCQPTMF